MNDAKVMTRLLAARPAPLTYDTTTAWRTIVDSAADPRLLSGGTHRKTASDYRSGRLKSFLRRPHSRRLAIFVTAGALVFGGAATAGVLGVEALIGSAPAGTLFRDDPQIWNQNNHNHPLADGVIQSSVKQVETLSIPRVGEIQYWVARTRGGGACEAFKYPNGVWAGTTVSNDRKYNFGGIVPGCHAPNRNGDVAEGGGFDFDSDAFGPSIATDPHAASDFTRVLFGTVDVSHAVRVRELGTVRTAPIVDGEFFAITEPEMPSPAAKKGGGRFQALDSSGKVLSTSWTQRRIMKAAEEGHLPR